MQPDSQISLYKKCEPLRMSGSNAFDCDQVRQLIKCLHKVIECKVVIIHAVTNFRLLMVVFCFCTLMMEATSTYETSVNLSDCTAQQPRRQPSLCRLRENLRSYFVFVTYLFIYVFIYMDISVLDVYRQ
jgi:hypothetical protein